MTTQKEIDAALARLKAVVLNTATFITKPNGHPEYTPNTAQIIIDDFKTLESALQRPVVEWQDISTAPRDIPVLGCNANNGCIDIIQLDTPVDWRYASPPTHWMPIPDVPKGE